MINWSKFIEIIIIKLLLKKKMIKIVTNQNKFNLTIVRKS